MKKLGVLCVIGCAWFLVACGGDDGSTTDTAGGNDTAGAADTNGGDDTGGSQATSCALTTASYVWMTRYVELKNDDGSCLVGFTVADKDGDTVDWANMIKSGDTLDVIEGWPGNNDAANVVFPCPDVPGGKCYAMEGSVTLTTFELTEAESVEGGNPAGKKIVGEVDAKATRTGNEGEAKFSFDLTF